MELRRVNLARVIGDKGKRRAVTGANNLEPFGNLRHAVAVAHPDLLLGADWPHVREQIAVFGNRQLGLSELAMMAAFDLAAKLHAKRLLAIADRKNRNPQIPNGLGGAWTAFFGGGGRTARKNNPLRGKGADGLVRFIKRMNLAVNAGLAHTPRDQLRDL